MRGPTELFFALGDAAVGPSGSVLVVVVFIDGLIMIHRLTIMGWRYTTSAVAVARCGVRARFTLTYGYLI